MRFVGCLIVSIVPAAILLLVLVVGAANQPAPSNPPAPQQKEAMVKLQDLTVPLPEGWEADKGNGFFYAHARTCIGIPQCTSIAIFGQDALAKTSWQQVVLDKYSCTSNPHETAAAFKPHGSTMVGGRGANHYTVALCGVSGTEKLSVHQTQIPPRVIVARQDQLPDVDKRLDRAAWDK